MTNEEKKKLMAILGTASEEALKAIKSRDVGPGKVNEDRFSVFAAAVRRALKETEEEYLGGGGDCEDCPFRDKCGAPEEVDLELNAMLVLMANEAAKEEGKTLSQWLTELIVKELFY